LLDDWVLNETFREKHLRNWLVNLSGKKDGFKELDLLQEHHNFWLKVTRTASPPSSAY
jgi:hypothetical protein